MQFAKSQIWGKAAKVCLNEVTKHAYESKTQFLAPSTVVALDTFVSCLRENRPRVIKSRWPEGFIVCTDASFEPTCSDWPAGLGGVLYSETGKPLACFSFKLSLEMLKQLGWPDRKTIILECELLAVLVSMEVWGGILNQSPVIFYIDNNAARDICIAGNA